jgi:hypothetical protein
MPAKRRGPRKPLSFADVRRIALSLPDVAEGPWYGTPGFKVRGKGFTRLKEKMEDVIVLGVGTMLERDFLIDSDPSVFFITDHYRDYPALLIRLAAIDEGSLTELLTMAWRRAAPKTLVAGFDAQAQAASGLDR